ncbi:capsular polysaccharide export protein, LipB/KpsS family [Metabacillus indicus]|uniref:capsular polysaccharide export protein, LipB/KpsS family n=1 Tax=Metabacillus indicus TaxID=246786 RepID=UPI00068C616C|nr:hypothetical protein [Metabacillus indicus]
MIGIFASQDERIPFLDSFLQQPVTYDPKSNQKKLTGMALLKNGLYVKKTKKFAEKYKLPLIYIEPHVNLLSPQNSSGFLTSLFIDSSNFPSDSSEVSELENLLNDEIVQKTTLSKIDSLVERFVKGSDIKDNGDIVIIDEKVSTIKDEIDDFQTMKSYVQNTFSSQKIKIISTLDGDGYFTNTDGFTIISDSDEATKAIEKAHLVCVSNSQDGLKALLYGKEVYCFGSPFYAGWGLTRDYKDYQSRKRQRSLNELLAISHFSYSKHINPFTGMSITPEELYELSLITDCCKAEKLKNVYCFGVQPWKRGFIRPFVETPTRNVLFPKSALDASRQFGPESEILVWGHKEPKGVKELASKWDIPIKRVEDGYIRSVGLGTNVTRPWSLAVDNIGIYYNPQEESELEVILNTHIFSTDMIRHAKLVQKKIVENQLTKYNSEKIEKLDIHSEGKKVILIPGQVEDDASIRYGCRDIKTNAQLLNEVRKSNPDAYIIYKPHPDIVAKNRSGAVTSDFMSSASDHIETKASIISCINCADEVHTMTSLTGFDALIRGKKVYTYGIPFYAGWGLTSDRFRLERRTRKLSIYELIAAALLIYPGYYDWENKTRVSCDTVIDKLIEIRNEAFLKEQKKSRIPLRLKKLGYLIEEKIKN